MPKQRIPTKLRLEEAEKKIRDPNVDTDSAEHIVKSEKLLGVETHSLSSFESWKNAVTSSVCLNSQTNPYMFMLATDGFSNSYPDEPAFLNTCVDYYAAIREHGPAVVSNALETWLNETSEQGSGDDVTVAFVVAG